jgi:NitT/TauT family transport system substrate-binding protein
MAKFHISSHGRLQDWIAVEKGYFTDAGLDFQFNVKMQENADQDIDAAAGDGDVRVGAYELYQSQGGGKRDMSSACHWAVNQSAVDGVGRMWGRAYSVLPCAIYVGAASEIRTPTDLAGVPVAVGHHSGSHFTTIQALEAYLEPDAIELSYRGMPWDRVDALLGGDVPAATILNAPTYLLEQQGCRKVLDCTFMAGFMFAPNIDPDDVERYFNALQRAQMDLDFEPERYKHYYLDEMPKRYHELVDVGAFGPGERVVFLPYTAEMYERAQQWMRERELFDAHKATPPYEAVVHV